MHYVDTRLVFSMGLPSRKILSNSDSVTEEGVDVGGSGGGAGGVVGGGGMCLFGCWYV